MKKLFLLFSLVFLAVAANAQTVRHTRDTLAASDTVYVYFPNSGIYNSPFVWEMLVQGDQISGTSYAKTWIEVQTTGSALWVPSGAADTVRITGTQTQARLSGSLLGGRVRAKTITGAGTQSTDVRASFIKAPRA